MDGLIELAIAVGRLENRVAELEKMMKEDRPPAPVVAPSFGDNEGKSTADKLLQEGLDNIMGYQWPPKRADE